MSFALEILLVSEKHLKYLGNSRNVMEVRLHQNILILMHVWISEFLRLMMSDGFVVRKSLKQIKNSQILNFVNA